MHAMHGQMHQDSVTAPERMAQHATAMQQRGAAMAAMSTALGSLYAVLTPEQKAVADQHVGMMGQHGMRHGPRAG
jgi:purine nucleoside phosphorylase